jgi:hypothetical protein
MPLSSPTAPDAAWKAARALTTPLPHTAGPVHPHPVYRIGLDDLAGAAGLPAARPTGWRWLVRDSRTDRVRGAVETGPDGLAAYSAGPFATSTASALSLAAALPIGVRRTYEPRLLDVPGLYMAALWLADTAGPGGGHDLVIPLSPAPPGVRALHPYRPEELARTLSARSRPVPVTA